MGSHHIYQVLYDTNIGRNKEIYIGTYSKKRIEKIIEEQIRMDMENGENSREVKDIGVKILGILYTGYKTNKEGPIGCSFDELIIAIKTQKK
jgi:hypothetical protein